MHEGISMYGSISSKRTRALGWSSQTLASSLPHQSPTNQSINPLISLELPAPRRVKMYHERGMGHSPNSYLYKGGKQ
jgi:hypothetical protein